MAVNNYNAQIREVVLHGKFFSDSFRGDKIDRIKENEESKRIEIYFKDGSTIIHSGSYTVDLLSFTKTS